MPQTHPYVAALADKARRRKNQQLSLSARKLIQGFGYERRTERVMNEITAQLEQHYLSTTISLTSPKDLDERITITALGPAAAPVAAAQPVSMEGDLREVAGRALPATVAISTETSIGSGFIVHAAGLVVTARHVLEEDNYSLRSVKVSLGPGMPNHQELEGVVFRSHRQLDFALLWLLDDGPFPTLPIGQPQRLLHAQTVLAIGCPSGLYNTVSRGIVANPRQPHRGIDYIQTDAAIDPGNSGGPLIGDDGVVGINEWIMLNIGAAKFSLPIDYLTDDIATAVRYGKQRCLEAQYCPACGHTEYEAPTWYCHNCGVQYAQPSA